MVAAVQDDIDAGRVVEETGPQGQPQPAADRDPAAGHRTSTASTPSSAGPGATRRRPGPRSGCSASATSSGSGIPATSAPSCGTCTTGATARASTSACSRCPTGPSSTSGSTSSTSRSSCRSLYYAHRRQVFERDGMLLAVSPFVTLLDGEEAFESTVRFRTIGDATCTGCVESAAFTADAGGDRSGGLPADRAGGDPRRRPHLRGRHGRPQEGRVFLMPGSLLRAAADRHRRQRGRRQVDPHRAAAVRLQGDLRGPAGRGGADQPGAGRRVHQPGPADRRPAGRARAGHHHRRRLPVLRHAPAASSSSPTPPATSSTPATWSPGRRPPTWPSS